MSKIWGSRIDLHYYGDGSDKVYHLAMEEVGDGLYNVWYAYGRRGSRFSKIDKKNKAPIGSYQARNLLDKFFTEKRGKGYNVSPGVSGDEIFPFESGEQEVETIVPEPEVIEEVQATDQEAALELLNQWLAEG